MSIILKGIDIPEKENRMYMMELYADGHCSVAKIEEGKCYELTMPSETQAIQIDRPHGRLIDENEIWFDHSVARSLDDGHNWDELVATKDGICGVPTILEAEE